jgi:hypothetical protein
MYMRPSRPSPRPARCRLLKTIAFSVSALGLVGTGPTDPGSGRGISPSKDRVAIPIFVPAFMTGYEINESSATPANEIAWMVFENTSPQQDAPPWAMSVFYENAGDVGDRYARVIDDPTTNEPNRVLHYWLKNATIDSGYLQHTKGRIQSGFPAQLDNAVEVYARQRVFIHEDVNLLLDYPRDADPWWIGVILEEFWMGAAWEGHPNPARINLSMFPFAGAMHLNLLCESMPNGPTLWSYANTDFELPIGTWITIEIGYKMGDENTGRMVVVVTDESTSERTIVFDVTDQTYNPAADLPGGTGPVALTHWNAQKLYSSDNVIHYIRDAGGVLQAYFDDFAFSGQWPTDWPSEP